MARLMFTGEQTGGIPFGGPGRTPSGAVYYGGNNLSNKYLEVPAEDVQWLLNTGLFEVVVQRQAVNLDVPAPKVMKLPTPVKRKAGTDVDDAAAESA